MSRRAGYHGDDALPIRVWTGERELHIVADVAWATAHLRGLDVATVPSRTGTASGYLVETARFWASRLERDADGTAHLRGVMGPDEYHELVDDDAFTNVMARWNLRAAAGSVRRIWRDQPARGLDRQPRGLEGRGSREALSMPTPEELEDWETLAASVVDGFDPGTRIYEQFAGFHRLEPVRIAELSERPVAGDVLLGTARVAQAQVVKQAAVVLLHHLVPDEVAADRWSRTSTTTSLGRRTEVRCHPAPTPPFWRARGVRDRHWTRYA